MNTKWTRAIALSVALVGVLTVLGAVFAGRYSQADILRRTPTPSFTPTSSNTPTDTDTPTFTLTPTFTRTPTFTPTPFATKDRADLFDTVIIGGSTGASFLHTSFTQFIPMFDGGVGGLTLTHLTLPGAITHLEVRIDCCLSQNQFYNFSLVVGGGKTILQCTIPSKGKGDFCEDGDKDNDCVEVGPQDHIAVQSSPKNFDSAGQTAGGGYFGRMSWVAKLDLYGRCRE